ncbi:MAG: ATP-binding protein [Acidobacteria bacterium]|nr:ATP-binding protein [Acidobacteriota bacterium]
MKRRSVRFRLTAWYAAVLAVTFAAVGAGVWLAMRESIHDTVDKDLRSRLHALRDYLEKQAADGDAGPLAKELEEQAALAPAGTRFRIAGADGRWIYQSPGAREWDTRPPEASRLRASGKAQTVVAGGEPLRVLSAPVPMGVVQIGIPIDEYYEMLDDFTWTALLASPLLLLLASAGGYWMSRRALEPVDRITRTAGEIGAQNLSARLPLRGAGDELDRLSATLNAMFARLEAAFQRISRFTADASHELRTPVAIIRTTAELARSKPRSENEYAAALDRILSESERTSRLIEDLMLLARADAGADGMVLEPMNLAGSVREACAEVRVLADAGQVRLAPGPLSDCSVPGDDHALRRLFLILLDNAIKYTQAGGEVRVSIRTENRMAVVEVRDTGAGISPEDLPHIFERFYRAAEDRSRATGGAGLGLSIAHWIAARHGGEILAESVPGAGSVFRVRLPLSS